MARMPQSQSETLPPATISGACPAQVLSIDPGRDKCGVAVVSASGTVRLRRIVARAQMQTEVPALVAAHGIEQVVLGHSTTARQMRADLQLWLPGVPISTINETGSTLEARGLYWQEHPPSGWRRLLPLALQVPPEPVDDFAAIVLAHRFFRN